MNFSKFNLDLVIANNNLKEYLVAIVVFLVIVLVFKILKNKVWHRLEKISKKTSGKADDKMVEVIKSIRPNFYFIFSLWFAVQFLSLSSILSQIINTLLIIVVFHQISISFQILLKYWVGKSNSAQRQNLLPLLIVLFKIILWSFGILLILSNLGINVTSLIAGLGIGGIAIALAIQSVLGDLFASLTIYFDKPFEVGDFIVLDSDTMGTVEQIGFRTSRIKALRGEEIVMSNSELTARKIHNYKKMTNRRIVIELGVVYGTSNEKMKKIPVIIKGITDSIDGIDFDRVHFKEFGDSALKFELVYFVSTADYGKYMDLNQNLHLQIKDRFEQEGIDMAFPSQTVYLHKD